VFNVVSLAREEARSFEDVETSMIELRKIMFNTLYIWIFARHSMLVSSFAFFFNFCSSFSSNQGFSCILHVY
jgi:hypothetical protein